MDSIHRPKRPPLPQAAIRPVEPRGWQATEAGEARPNLAPQLPPSAPIRVQSRPWRWLWWCVGLLFIMGAGGTLFLLFKLAQVSHHLSFENTAENSFFTDIGEAAHHLFARNAPLKHTQNGRMNILLLGRAGERYPGRNLTDTIMLASVDTVTHRVALLSFPRDLYAPIGTSEQYTKINAIYQIGLNTQSGVDLLKETIQNLTGEPVHYSIIVDFDGFEKIIDTLGGISVDVPRDLYDTRYPGKNYSYETFSIQKGWQKLDGATALKYVRERHADPEGDFGRARRQQQVMQAVRDKAFSSGTLLNILTLSRLIDALGESVKTDMSTGEIESLLSLIRTLDTKNITSVVIDAWKKESLLRVSHIPTPSGNAFILVPRTGNWKEISTVAQNIFTLDDLAKERARVAGERASIRIVTTAKERPLAQALGQFLTDELGFADVHIEITRLENVPERSTLSEMGNRGKLYSYNTLLSRFDLDRGPTLPLTSLSSTDPARADSNEPEDFVLTLGQDIRKSNFLAEIGAMPEDPSSEVLPPTLPLER